jgi:hypothetical protein
MPIEVFVFHFDLVGIVDAYSTKPNIVDTVTDFQRAVRALPTRWGEEYSFVVTAFDNVMCRVNANDNAADYAVVEFAADTMRVAEQYGFTMYFGAVTRGVVSIDLFDQTLVSGGDPTDIRSQHLSLLGEPQIRAAFAEKWSARLARGSSPPFNGASCTWVSEEVFEPMSLPDLARTGNPRVRVLPGVLDLKASVGEKPWPFEKSRFSGVRPL